MAGSDVLLVTLPCFLGMQVLLCNLTPVVYAIPLGYLINPQDISDYIRDYSSANYRPYFQTKRNREPWMSLLTSAFLREAADHVGDHGYRGLRGKK